MFFTQLKTMLESHNVNMVMSMENGKMLVSVFPRPKKDVSKVVQMFPPLNLSGSPEELDKEFFTYIGKITPKTGSIITNIQIYAAQMKAKEDAAQKKAAEKTAKKTTATSSTASASKSSSPAQPAAQPTMFDEENDDANENTED